MLISCPNCDTQFAVPEAALGATGRMLKCARCGHKWFQPAPLPPQAAEDHGADGLLPGFENFSFGSDSAAPDAATATVAAGDASDFDLDDEPEPEREPIPEALKGDSARRGSDQPQRGRGVGLLWILALLLLLAGGGGYAAFVFQNRLVEFWPAAADYLETIGLRREVIGAGLDLRKLNAERLVQGDAEVLVVRGIVANVTDQPREVPAMRLALYDEQTLLQEKVEPPPVDGLDPGATTSFRIVIEQLHPMVTRFEVSFADQFAEASDPDVGTDRH